MKSKWQAKDDLDKTEKSAEATGPAGAVGLEARRKSASNARPARMVVSRSDVVAGQRVSLGAMGLLLVRKAAFPRGVEKVLALRPNEKMVGPHAAPIVARMADDSPFGDSAVVELPRIAMRGHVSPGPKATVPTDVEKARPFPTALGLLNARPETRNDLFGGRPMLLGTDIDATWHTPIYA